MKSMFSENIKALRKAHHVTQEQLAEAMGVTSGAIYKWEQNISTPDIGLIMELASFFGVSVDALVGYKMCNSDKQRILQTLRQIELKKSYEVHLTEFENWLNRYPNDFDIVYHIGSLYYNYGIESKNNAHLTHSIQLLRHACTLIDQNNDPKISETAIWRSIAIADLILGNEQEGFELLKAHNPCGVNDDLIGQELACRKHHRKEALPYLSMALLQSTASLYRIVLGYVNLFNAQKDYSSAISILEWHIAYLDGLKTSAGCSYLDKGNAMLLTVCASLYYSIGQLPQAKNALRRAREIALAFDAAPDYTSQNIRYCTASDPHVSSDNIGSTAEAGILHLLKEEDPSPALLAMWEELCNEK